MSPTCQIDDAIAEALFAGRAVPDDLAPLTRVVAAFREAARQPVRPTGELAARMATGLFGRPPALTRAGRRPPAGR